MRVAPNSKLALIGIFALYCTLCDFAILTPALNTLSNAFPSTSMTTILLANTITGVVVVPVSIVAGILVNYVGYRPMGIIGVALAMFGGLSPFFFPELTEYWPIIISRIVVGVGDGMVSPLGGAMIIALYRGKQRATLLGVGNLIFFGSGILYQLAGGYLASIGWNYTFLGYLVAFIPWVLAIVFLPELKGVKPVEDTTAAISPNGKKEKLPPAVWGYFSFATIMLILDIVAVFLCSTLLDIRGMGDASVAGIVSALFTVGGTIAGAIYAVLILVFRNKVFSTLAFVGGVGLLIMYFSDNVFLFSFGITILGIAHIGLFTAAQNAAGNASPPSKIPVTNGLMMAAMNLGSFLGAYYLSFVQETLPSLGAAGPLMVSGVVFLVAAAVMLFLPFKNLIIKNK